MSDRAGIGVWMVLAACAALIVGAMGWLTHNVMSAEDERSLAESRAALEEKIRLSLWRMDAMAAALVIEENQRSLLGEQSSDVPNPLVKMRFRVGINRQVVALKGEDTTELNKIIGSDQQFQQMCADVTTNGQWGANNDYAVQLTEQGKEQQVQALAQQSQIDGSYQDELNISNRAYRGKSFNYLNQSTKVGNTWDNAKGDPGSGIEASPGAFQPSWINNEAFLLRQVSSNGGISAIEGVWIHRKEFSEALLNEISDLLPFARLEQSIPGESAGAAMEMASFPWRLVAGEEPIVNGSLRGPVLASLTAGWVAVGIALLAGMALVRGILRLSERRASFVSAVTHELRTPLTTFRLYSDMLDSGAVADEKKRAGYFRTLRREADRLSHLVENVLAFSRIEKKSTKQRLDSLDLNPMLEGMEERFRERLVGAGLDLKMNCQNGIRARGDSAAIEHVLFNLVDNAAKYAVTSDPPEVTITTRKSHGKVEIEVSDCGPGIPAAERRRIFHAFHKSAQTAAESQPGVGLGLALSRRLARDMGGDLECRGKSKGSSFVLILPLVE